MTGVKKPVGIFDLGGVLFTDGTQRFIATLQKQHGCDVAVAGDLIDGELGTAYRSGTISRDQFWRTLTKELSLAVDIDKLEECWIAGYEVIETTRSLLETLRTQHGLYYLSDNVPERVRALEERYGFSRLFDGGVFSYELGVRKPDVRMYEAVLQLADVAPSDSYFVDDKPSSLIPAAELGMEAILFEGADLLEDRLVAGGLLSI